MNISQVREITDDEHAIAEKIGIDFPDWAHQCHVVSLRIVKARIFPYARVARGWTDGVISQHSWVSLHHDVYNGRGILVDPTLWSYDRSVDGIWVGRPGKRHFPHGSGNIWTYGAPASFGGEPVELTPGTPLSRPAAAFLEAVGPLDRRGWANFVSNFPMQGWPAAEIIAAVDDTPQLSAYIPVDILGMLTDRNPRGLYLADDAEENAA